MPVSIISNGCFIEASTGDGGRGFGGLGIWRYRTDTGSTPATGELQFDNLDIDSATNLYINEINDTGTDMSAFLSLVTVGDLIYIQAQAQSTQFVTVQVGTPSFSAGVFTFPLTVSEAQGAQLADNQYVNVVTTKGAIGIGLQGITVSDEGSPLATLATALDFVGDGVDATGTGASKTITIPGGITVEDEGSPLATIADTLDFVGIGVVASGTGTTKTITYDYLHPDLTDNLTVGYTTDVEADTFTNPLVPDFQLEYFKTTTVTGDFTLNTPTGNSHGEYYLTVDSGGPYTLTAGTNVVMMDSNVTLLASENYILNIHRYSATNTVAQLLLVQDSIGVQWLTVEDEGTPLATLATTLNFTGTGVDATGTGAEKTITIPSGNAYINLPAAAESSKTIVAADTERIYYVDLNGGAYTLNLPAIATVDERVLTLKAIDSVAGGTAYTLAIDPDGTEQIEDWGSAENGPGTLRSAGLPLTISVGTSITVQANDSDTAWWVL